jgi:hypothetical protein
MPFPADQPISLRIAYTGGGGGALVHYVGPEFVIASGIVQPWFPQFSAAKVIGSLSLEMPSGFLAVASGEKVSERVRGDRRTIDYRLTSPTRIDFAAGPLKVIKVPQRKGEVPVNLYLLRDREFAADLVAIVRSSITTLEREFGDFPYREFAVVEFPSEPAGLKAFFSGASQGGYILMSSGDLDGRRADPRNSFFAHEIGHQWWGPSVSASGGDGGAFMLDEALAEYGAFRVNESLLGPEGVKAFRADERDKVITRIAAGYDGPLADMPESPPSGPAYFFQDVARSKGALAYDAISQGIGADRMRRFFHEITSVYAHSTHLTWHDFVVRLKEAAGPDKQWLVDQWFTLKGLPVLDLRWSARNGEVAIEIIQQQPAVPPFRLVVPVRLVYADGTTELPQIEISALPQTRLVLPAVKTVSRVELDPERTMPWVSPLEFATAVSVKNFTVAAQLDGEGRQAEAESILRTALAARTEPDPTPGEFLERYLLGWLLEEMHGTLPDALDEFMRALRVPVRDERRLPQLYVNIARVSSAMDNKAQARWAAQAALALIDGGEDDARARRIREQVQQYLRN